MDKVLLDSDVIIEWLRGHEPFVSQVASLLERSSELFWTPVSVAEIYAGVRKGEESRISKLFVLMESLDVSMAHGKTAGEYLKAYSKSHGVELGDALIAACSTTEALLLWTLNKTHYPMKDVRFFSPEAPSAPGR
jgi:predicted nucleic acid-binding protein